jgi:hypothetical protein
MTHDAMGQAPHTRAPQILLTTADLALCPLAALLALRAALADLDDGPGDAWQGCRTVVIQAIDTDLLSRRPQTAEDLCLLIQAFIEPGLIWEDGLDALLRAATEFLTPHQSAA